MNVAPLAEHRHLRDEHPVVARPVRVVAGRAVLADALGRYADYVVGGADENMRDHPHPEAPREWARALGLTSCATELMWLHVGGGWAVDGWQALGYPPGSNHPAIKARLRWAGGRRA